MKSIKLRKVGLSLAGAVFAGVMVFNAHLIIIEPKLFSNITLEKLIKVALAQEEEDDTAYCDTLIDDTYTNDGTCNGVSKPLHWRRDFTCSTGGSGQPTEPHCWQGYLINQRQIMGYGSNCYFTNWTTTTHAATAYEC